MALLRTSLWPSLLVLGVGNNAGCRIIQCAPHDPSASTISTVSVTSGRVLSARGRVLSIETGQPLSSARARMTSNGKWHDVDSAGRVELPVPGPGSYTIEVMAPGYDAGNRVVAVRVDSSVSWIAAMARSNTPVRDRACGVDTTIGSTPST